MKNIIKDENYIVTHGWMINKLNLSGNNLKVYSIIYGFTQDDKQWFNGSREYLAAWCNCTVRGIQKNLNYLVENNLILKRESSKFNQPCEYKYNREILDEINKQ